MKFKILIILLAVLLPAVLTAQQVITMDEAVRTALEKNPELKAAKYLIEKEEAGTQSVFNLPKPKLFVEYEGVKGSLSNFESRKFGISQDFEFPTVYFDRVSVQDYSVKIAEAEYELLQLKTRSEVKENYIKYQYQSSLLRISSENLKVYDDFVYVAQRRYEEGAGDNLELLSAKVNKMKYDNLSGNLKSEIVSTQSNLMRLLSINEKIVPEDVLKFKEYSLFKDEMISLVRTNNPELKKMRYRKLQSDSRISLAVSRILPDFSISYYRQELGSQGGFYGFEVGVGIPLWFWWEQSGNLQEADLELKSVSSEEAGLLNRLEAELTTAYEMYENSLRKISFFNEGALVEANQVIETATKSYEVGAADYSQYLQAINIANETIMQYMEALYDYNISIIKLESLTGKEIL